MARKVDLRDNLDIARCRIGYNLANLLLSVETTILLVPLTQRGRKLRVATTKTANLSKLRVRLNLDTPTLTIREVPVELVNLVVSDIVDIAQHILLGHKCTRHVEHKATICELRLILNLATLHLDRKCHLLGVDLARKELQECLHAVECATITARNNLHSLVRHRKSVLLLGKRLVERERDIVALWSNLRHAAQLQILERIVSDRLKQLGIAYQRCRG